MNAPELEAGRWFRQSQADLEVVRTLQGAKHHAAACFHAQQAAEKALKAVLFSQGSRMVPAHSVRELARQCQQHEPALAAVADEAALLDQFYIPTRYPNALPSPAIPSESYTATQAEMAQAVAARAVRAVENYLRVHTHVLG